MRGLAADNGTEATEMTQEPPQASPPAASTKVTVKLSPRTMAALDQASRLGGLNKTDTINRGIQFYAKMLEDAEDSVITVLVGGKPERFHL